MNVEEIIETLVQEKLDNEDWSDVFILEVRYIQPKNTVQVFLDSEDSLTHDQCKQVSRYVEEYLDESSLLGDKYVLEVSSGGLDRSLTDDRQYRKNLGREMRVILKDGSQMIGNMVKVDDEFLDLELEQKAGNKTVTIPRDEIKEVYVQIKF